MDTKRPDEQPDDHSCVGALAFVTVIVFGLLFGSALIYFDDPDPKSNVPDIKIVHTNFKKFETISESSKWDLLIRLPPRLPGNYICIDGEFQASLLYKGVSIATTPTKSYTNLKHIWPQLLGISGVVYEEDIKSMKDDDSKENAVRIAVLFSDCRTKTIGMMKYVCDDIILRYDPSTQEITTNVSEKSITCHYDGQVVSTLDNKIQKISDS